MVAINNSWGYNVYSKSLDMVVREAGGLGAVSTFAAGNERRDIDMVGQVTNAFIRFAADDACNRVESDRECVDDAEDARGPVDDAEDRRRAFSGCVCFGASQFFGPRCRTSRKEAFKTALSRIRSKCS